MQSCQSQLSDQLGKVACLGTQPFDPPVSFDHNSMQVAVMLEGLELQFRNQSWWENIKGPLRELTSILDYTNMKLRPLPGTKIKSSAELKKMINRDNLS